MDEVRRAGFVVKPGATMIWGVEREPWSWYFRETHASNPHSYQVWRPDFDAILLNNARRTGVDVREGWQATQVVFDDKGAAAAVRCVRQMICPRKSSWPARYVVDASGQSGVLSRQLGLREVGRFLSQPCGVRYYKGGKGLPTPDEGNILIESQPDGWLWHIPCAKGGQVSARWWMQKSVSRASANSGARRFLESQVAAAPYLAGLLESATLLSGPEVVRTGHIAANR